MNLLAFQSPLGEVVKETTHQINIYRLEDTLVSIPSRGSGKGDFIQVHEISNYPFVFQSPLGEVVKETVQAILTEVLKTYQFQSPLGEVVKETLVSGRTILGLVGGFNPLSGKW